MNEQQKLWLERVELWNEQKNFNWVTTTKAKYRHLAQQVYDITKKLQPAKILEIYLTEKIDYPETQLGSRLINEEEKILTTSN